MQKGLESPPNPSLGTGPFGILLRLGGRPPTTTKNTIGFPAMKLTIERADLLTALSHVQSVVERRNTIPILSNVLLEADGEHLALTATDLDIAVVENLPAQVAQPAPPPVAAHPGPNNMRNQQE